MSRAIQTPPFVTSNPVARVTVTVRCDGCHEELVGSTAEAPTTTEALELAQHLAAIEARDRGWRMGPGDEARCPRCRRRA